MSSSTLLLGGARSGKSQLAIHLGQTTAEGLGSNVVALVTAEPIDSEMEERIARHRAERPAGWSTVEAPYDLVEAVAKVPLDSVVVLDCVTVWLTNLLVRGDAPASIEEEALELTHALLARRQPTIVVSNEIGLGLVPGDPVSRSFRDIQGRVNQALALHLDHVFLVVAGRLLALQSGQSVARTLGPGGAL